MSTSATGVADVASVEAKKAKYLAGYQATAHKGITDASVNVNVRAARCAGDDIRGQATGLGAPEASGTPSFLGNVTVMCLGLGQPSYRLEASVCGEVSSDARVQPGDVVEIALHVEGTTMTVTATDGHGASVTKQGDLADCSPAHGKKAVKKIFAGWFTIYLEGSGDPVIATPVEGGPTPALWDYYANPNLRANSPGPAADATFKRLVRKDASGTVTPTDMIDNSFDLLYDPKAPACAVTHDGGDTGLAIASQNFEADLDLYDATAADDFVSGEDCVLSSVDIVGAYFNGTGPAASETITFYGDAGGAPGPVISTETVMGTDNGTGSFQIPLSTLVLTGGQTYWISAQANLDYAAGGQWGWENTTTADGSPATWENPADGFGTGCTTWSNLQACTAAVGPDLIFSLH